MPVAGPYRSHFLNHLRRSSQQLAQHCQQKIRQVQIQAVWGVQVALFPLFRLFQRRPLAWGQGLASKGWQQLQAWSSREEHPPVPPADQPIQKLLQAIQIKPLQQHFTPSLGIPAPAATEITIKPLAPKRGWKKWRHQFQDRLQAFWQDALALPKAIVQPLQPPWAPRPSLPVSPTPFLLQGVAVELSSQELVLVADHNQVLNVLNPSQQKQLHQHLIWEFAEYCRQVRLAARVLNQPHLLAAATVKFALPKLPAPAVAPGMGVAVVLPQPHPWRPRLLHLVTQLTQGALMVVKPWMGTSPTPLRRHLPRLPNLLAPLVPVPPSSPTAVQGMFTAVISLFRDFLPGSVALSPEPAVPDQSPEQLPDLWGTATSVPKDLPIPPNSAGSTVRPRLTPAPPLPQLHPRLRQYLRQSLVRFAQMLRPRPHPVPGGAIQQATPARIQVASPSSNLTSAPALSPLLLEVDGGCELTHSTRWGSLAPLRDGATLDTETVVMGYEKHLLERILMLLDWVMVWIERLSLWLWRSWLKVWR